MEGHPLKMKQMVTVALARLDSLQEDIKIEQEERKAERKTDREDLKEMMKEIMNIKLKEMCEKIKSGQM